MAFQMSLRILNRSYERPQMKRVVDKALRHVGCLCFPVVLLGKLIRRVLRFVHWNETEVEEELELLVVKKNYKDDIAELKKTFYAKLSKCETKSQLRPRNFDWKKLLGTGCYGQVVLAQNKISRVHYAVKVYNKQKTAIEVFLVMEPCLGGSLHSLLEMKKKFCDDDVRFYSAQMFLAIDFLHSLSIMHRDIKLENFVLASNGYLKLTDFGFAKKITDRTGTLCGSKIYIAPEILEQFLGFKRYDYGIVADWWSYGVCLFFMSAGRPPYAAEGTRDLYDEIKDKEVQYPKDMNVELVELIKHLLVVEPRSRYGTCGTKCIQCHPWFNDVQWSGIFYREVEAPAVQKADFPDLEEDFHTWKEGECDEFRDF